MSTVAEQLEAQDRSVARWGGITAIAGSICAVTGASLLFSTGADLDIALATGEIATYLSSAGASAGALAANLSVWIAMVFLMGVAGTAMATLGRTNAFPARLGMFAYWTGVPLVTSAYVAWLAIVIRIAPDSSPVALAVAEAVGWYASRADWVATSLILAVGPALVARAGDGVWAPRWLQRWTWLSLAAGVLNLLALLTGGGGLATWGFLIIPVGVLWTIAAGIVLLRHSRVSPPGHPG